MHSVPRTSSDAEYFIGLMHTEFAEKYGLVNFMEYIRKEYLLPGQLDWLRLQAPSGFSHDNNGLESKNSGIKFVSRQPRLKTSYLSKLN